MSVKYVAGRWIAGPNAGKRSTLSEVRAGLVYGSHADGTRVLGHPSEFVADTGETGEGVLKILLTNPRASSLTRGAVREALAATYSVAMLGWQETRAWDEYYRYIIDNNEGSFGVVKFDSNGAVGAFNEHEFQRSFDVEKAIRLAPAHYQGTLRSLVGLPIFQQNDHRAIASIFWTEDDLIRGPEDWHDVYIFGGELLRRELADDVAWRSEAREHYGFSDGLLDVLIRVMARFTPMTPLLLTDEESSALIPENAPFRAEALEQLYGGGVIRPA